MKPALRYVVILLLLLVRLQSQPVANGCCDAFCAALCRGFACLSPLFCSFRFFPSVASPR
ncbi:hypothetical protein C4D60_Mb09t09670 [Musa balbisiana]|uniref:Hydrophobic seed protein domain-containing protein n=1 Tax=Musa balbisiana TaxID=52838 RepID=A0A4S8IF75_MUSBA|nr:hypothetical protein C4D60_Mb09t09670 [Musa balbisiana]